MKQLVSGVMIVMMSLSAAAAMEIQVTPQGDGIVGKDRWGYSSWDDVPFNATANPNTAMHWYDSGDGQSRDTYMQVAISSLPDVDSITEATLYINMLSVSGNGCSFYHAADSSPANGSASQMISSTEYIGEITAASGWLGLDVTGYVKNDVANGYNWAAFKFANNSYSSVSFSSGECGDLAPYLSVAGVPEPATLLLIAAGGLGLIVRKK